MLPEGTQQLVSQCASVLPGLTWEPHESVLHTKRPAAFGYDEEGRRIIVSVAAWPTTFSVEISHCHERRYENDREVYVNTSGDGEGATLVEAYALALASYVEACDVKRPIFPEIP